MSDITVKYGSTGFEKIAGELAQLEKTSGGAAKWFTPMSAGAKEAETEVSSMFSKLKSGAGDLVNSLGPLVSTLAGVTAGVGGLVAIVGGAGVAAFTAWSASVLKTTEGFRQLEISLYGALKSWDAVNKVSTFAKEYAAEYPAMYGDVMKAMQSLAFIPSTKEALMKGDIQTMKEFMHVVQSMVVMRPEQGVQGAMFALREALAGNWRSLQFRFDIPIQSIAKSAGLSLEEMKSSPQEAMKALSAWTKEFVGADTMAMSAKNLTIQIGNLKDKYDMWLDTIGKSGVYQKVVDYIIKLNEWFDTLMKSDKMAKWTKDINDFMESVADTIAGVFTKGIDWSKIESAGDLMKALKTVGENAMEELKKVWVTIKEPLANAMKDAFVFAGTAAVGALKEVVLPGIMEIISGIGKAFEQNKMTAAAEGGLGGATKAALSEAAIKGAGGAYIGSKIAGGPGAAVGGLLGVASGGWMDIFKLTIEEGSKGVGYIVDKVKDLAGIKPEPLKLVDPADQKRIDEAVAGYKKLNEELQRMNSLFTAGKEGKYGYMTALTEKQEAFLQWMRKPLFEEKAREKTPWEAGPEAKMEYYGRWGRMAGMMAKQGEVPSETAQWLGREEQRESMRQKWVGGQIETPEWRKYLEGTEKEDIKRGRMEGFTKEREEMLNKILVPAMEKKEYGVAGKAYEELFNISYQKGDFGKAQDYMNKSLDALLKQMEKQDKTAMEDSASLKSISDNTGKMANGMIDWGKRWANMGGSTEGVQEKTAGVQTSPTKNWSEDELMSEVKRALEPA